MFRLFYNILHFVIEKSWNAVTAIATAAAAAAVDDDVLFACTFVVFVSFFFGLRTHSKYVHQQTEHDAIKLLFIFVFISFHHHTSFFLPSIVPEEKRFVAFVFISLSVSRSLTLSFFLILFYFHSIFVAFHLFRSRTSLLFTKQYIKTPLRAWYSLLFTYALAQMLLPNKQHIYSIIWYSLVQFIIMFSTFTSAL